MHARLAATLICLCGSAMPALAGGAPQEPRPPTPSRADVSPAKETRDSRAPAAQPAPQATPDPQGSRQAPPPPADAAQRERGLLLAGIALMVGIALRRLGSGAP